MFHCVLCFIVCCVLLCVMFYCVLCFIVCCFIVCYVLLCVVFYCVLCIVCCMLCTVTTVNDHKGYEFGRLLCLVGLEYVMEVVLEHPHQCPYEVIQ